MPKFLISAYKTFRIAGIKLDKCAFLVILTYAGIGVYWYIL